MSQASQATSGTTHVSGMMRVVVHMAWPSSHLRTASFFNPRCVERGINATLVPWEVRPENLASAWDGLRHVENLAGVILTLPHKQAAANLCDFLEGDAAALQVVNVARRLTDGVFAGRMYDGVGLVQGMKNQGLVLEGKRTLLLGAGGAATAIALSLARSGVACITIANRSIEKATQLVELVEHEHPGVRIESGPADPSGQEIVINATSLGLKPDDPLPCDCSRIDAGTIVAEVVMQPPVTRFLGAAAERGAIVHKGEHMITAQVDLLIDFLLAD
jgi:shikimate dehydrogenase